MKNDKNKKSKKHRKHKKNKQGVGKRLRQVLEQIDKGKLYGLDEALQFLLGAQTANFDESVDLAVHLGLDVKKNDQQLRASVILPNGLGKEVKVLVFAKGEKEEEAKKAGADWIGAEDMVEKIKSGWLDFDRVLASPDMMPMVAKTAKILGPKGLMPSPKTGSVTVRLAQAVTDEKKGKALIKTDKNGIVHASIGKKSMGFEKLKKNCLTFVGELIKLKPKAAKGIYLRGLSISSSMGPGLKLQPTQIQSEAT